MYTIQIARLGRVDYGEALRLQESLLELRRQDKIGDTLILLEHPPVITLGRRGAYSNILLPIDSLEKQGVKVYEVTRGGDVTYHGPGQIVGYPIIKLSKEGADLKLFVQNIMSVFTNLLKDEFGIVAGMDEKKYTGVWVGDNKITAIGIAVSHFVTMHGFAFNVNTDLSHYKWINPCGITDKGITSLQQLTGEKQDMDTVMGKVGDYFCSAFNAQPKDISLAEIEKLIAEGNV